MFKSDLEPVALALHDASGNRIKLTGAVPFIISDVATRTETRQLIYFSEKAGRNNLLLSYEICVDLGYSTSHGKILSPSRGGKNSFLNRQNIGRRQMQP